MQNFPDQNVQRYSVMSLETARSLAIGPSLRGGGGAGEGEVCILHSPGTAASPISLLSMGGVRLWAVLSGGKNSLHWKANMLSLFSSIMTL